MFEEFAKFVDQQVSAPAFHIKGIGISSNLDQGFFSTTFAGRTLQFQFESVSVETKQGVWSFFLPPGETQQAKHMGRSLELTHAFFQDFAPDLANNRGQTTVF